MRVASAPVSFGIFELTADDAGLPDPVDVLDAIAETGHEGTELGPPGYLGNQTSLRERFERRGLVLAGGYIPIRCSEPQHWDDDLHGMSETLDLFAAAGGSSAKAVLADAVGPAPRKGADTGADTDRDRRRRDRRPRRSGPVRRRRAAG